MGDTIFIYDGPSTASRSLELFPVKELPFRWLQQIQQLL